MRLASGDEDAMRDFIERFGPMVKRMVHRLTAFSPDTDDLVQDVFLKAWTHALTYDGVGPLEAWLRRIAVNHCRNHRRARGAFQRLLHGWFERHSDSIGHTLEARQSDSRTESVVQFALSKLNPNDRTALVLFYMEGLSGKESASAMNISTEAFHVRLHRARAKFREAFNEAQ